MIETQRLLIDKNKEVTYHGEFYNKLNDTEQWIRLSDGCFRDCWNCYCPKDKVSYGLPKIERNKVVLLDMNFLWAYPDPLLAIAQLGCMRVNNKKIYYDFCCGLDFELLTQPMCHILKMYRFGRFNNKRRFIPGLRLAWDRSFKEQRKLKRAIGMLLKAGYKPQNLQMFILANGAVPFEECVMKLDLLKVWNIQVCDCWYDNQTRGNVKPEYWSKSECESFGKMCRTHNHLVNYGINPDI